MRYWQRSWIRHFIVRGPSRHSAVSCRFYSAPSMKTQTRSWYPSRLRDLLWTPSGWACLVSCIAYQLGLYQECLWLDLPRLWLSVVERRSSELGWYLPYGHVQHLQSIVQSTYPIQLHMETYLNQFCKDSKSHRQTLVHDGKFSGWKASADSQWRNGELGWPGKGFAHYDDRSWHWGGYQDHNDTTEGNVYTACYKVLVLLISIRRVYSKI